MEQSALLEAARRGLKAGPPLQDPVRLMRIAIGMLAVSIVGLLLRDPEAQLLITIGAFLATIAAVTPHQRSRVVATLLASIGQIVAAGLGMLVAGEWWIVIPVTFAGLFAAGMMRAVHIGISIRWTVITIVFLAFAEIWTTLTLDPGPGVLYFAIGFAIMNLAQLIPPYGSRHSAQRRAVASFYRAFARWEGDDGRTLLAADRSLALLRFHRHPEISRLTQRVWGPKAQPASPAWMKQLVERGEEVAQLLLALRNAEGDAEPWRQAVELQARAIADRVEQPRRRSPIPPCPWPSSPESALEVALASALEAATRLASGHPVPDGSDERQPPTSLDLVRDELRPGSTILRHALRVAITGIIAQVVGLGLGALLGSNVLQAGHGFWVVVAAVLIVFPDYGSTFSRGIARTIGTMGGVVAGVALSFLPMTSVAHTIVMLLVFYGYLAFRSCGQAYTMFWVVTWIALLTPGPLGATTRGLATLVGCALAFVAYLLAPTWQRRLLTEQLREWAQAAADHLDALAALWSRDSERNRVDVAQAVVRNRLVRLDFDEAAKSARLEPADRDGRWPNEAIDRAIDAVVAISKQISALSALGPIWTDVERAHAAGAASTQAAYLRASFDLGSADSTGTPWDDGSASPADADRALARIAATRVELVEIARSASR